MVCYQKKKKSKTQWWKTGERGYSQRTRSLCLQRKTDTPTKRSNSNVITIIMRIARITPITARACVGSSHTNPMWRGGVHPPRPYCSRTVHVTLQYRNGAVTSVSSSGLLPLLLRIPRRLLNIETRFSFTPDQLENKL